MDQRNCINPNASEKQAKEAKSTNAMSMSTTWSATSSNGNDALAAALDNGTNELPIGLCRDCSEDGQVLDRVLLQHFELRVCITCKQDRNLRDGAYELISKSRAKSDFALPDSFFHGLLHMCKPNPRHESFAPLKLFLKETIVSEAHRLYGDDDGLARELEARRRRAYTSAAKRTKHLLKRKHVLLALDSEDGNRESSRARKELQKQDRDPQQQQHEQKQSLHKQQSRKAPTKQTYVPVADRDHKHAFAAEVHDKAANAWFKECACGMKVEVEKW